MNKVSIGDACIVKTGKLDSNNSVDNGKYPFFTCSENPDRIDNFAFDEDAVLVAGNNAQGKFHLNRYKGKFNAYQRTYILTAKPEFDIDFIYYSLKLELKRLREKSQGSQTKFLTMSLLTSVQLRKLGLDDQQRIASVLSSLDSKIELNNRINSELESMAKTLYDYWFVQFDFPDANGKPYKSSGGKMVWNEQLKRPVPEGWWVKRIGDLLYTSLGGTPSTLVKEYWENGTINWLNSGEIAKFPIVDSEMKVNEAAIANSATELLPKGSVMLSITRHLRPSVLAIDACTNQSVVGIKEHGDIKYFFLYPFLKNEIPRLNSMRTGAQQPHINKETVDDTLILTPSSSSNVLRNFNSIVKPMYEMIMNNAFQNQQLSHVRDWLLPMLMNGQVRVG